MAETTVTVRGVNSDAWKEFQSGIVSLYGNLYGNIGQEVTNALKLWLEKYHGVRSATSLPASRLSVSYKDIGGLKEEIQLAKETVEIPLKHPELFKWLNLVPPKGVLIYGPPGTGKNILARAATAEAEANLLTLSIQRMTSEFNEMALRGVFHKAKETAPSVILISDLKMMSVGQKAPGDPRDQIISWLLSEMDALENFGQVVVIGIVSDPEELEPSLRQRFQQEIKVNFPDKQGRHEILKIITKKMPLADDVDLEKLAEMTDKWQGDRLWKICQKAATYTLRRALEHETIDDEEITKEKLERTKVEMNDFLRAIRS